MKVVLPAPVLNWRGGRGGLWIGRRIRPLLWQARSRSGTVVDSGRGRASKLSLPDVPLIPAGD